MSVDGDTTRPPTGPARQPTPLFNVAPTLGASSRERTLPPQVMGAASYRLSPPPPNIHREQNEEWVGRRRRGSGSEEQNTRLWGKTPSPRRERRQSHSPNQSDDEGHPRNRFRDPPMHLRAGQQERIMGAPSDEYATQRDYTAMDRPGRAEGRPGRSSPGATWDLHGPRQPMSPHARPPDMRLRGNQEMGGVNGNQFDGMRHMYLDHTGYAPPMELGLSEHPPEYRGARPNLPDDGPPFRHQGKLLAALDVDMRRPRDTSSQQLRDMATLVSQLASKVPLLKSNPTPPATAADNDSISPLFPDVATHAVAVPLATTLRPAPRDDAAKDEQGGKPK